MSAICKHTDIRRKQHGVRIAALFLCVLLLMLCPGCGGKQRYSVTYADVFDTVTTFTAYTESRAEFDALAEQLHAQLLEDHRRSDIYHEYPGLVNLCTLNKKAGEEAVQVDGELMDLLQFGARWHELTGGKLNIAMGAVLALWQEARETAAADPDSARLPEGDRLREAAAHCSMADLALDTESGTVRYLDPELKLDVGAVAKGWAQSRAMELLDRARCTSWLLNMGGSVSCRGTKPDGSPWTIGLEDPLDKSLPMRTFLLTDSSAVTSGVDQRYYLLEGKRYHHLIDPDTGFPCDHCTQVTIILPNPLLADALSTALFLMDQEAGSKLARELGAEALWILPDGSQIKTGGFPEFN